MPRILVVDDVLADRRLAGGLLEKITDWEISYAEDGKAAIARMAEDPVDLVLTDIQMPRMDGLELVCVMKASHPAIPVILMTGAGSEAIAVRALESGAASYVPKVELNHDLVDVIERVIAAVGEKLAQSQLMERMEKMESQFHLSNEPSLLLSLVAHLQKIVTQMKLFAESERLRIGVALEEALLNAAYHGNLEVSSSLREQDHSAYYRLAKERAAQAPYKDRRIHVDVLLSAQKVCYVIQDEGPGFDPGSLPDPTDPANLERPCGRGLLLMRTFMDKIEFNDSGNRVTMTKLASAARAVT